MANNKFLTVAIPCNQSGVVRVRKSDADAIKAEATADAVKQHAAFVLSAVQDRVVVIRDMAHINRKGRAAFGKVI